MDVEVCFCALEHKKTHAIMVRMDGVPELSSLLRLNEQ